MMKQVVWSSLKSKLCPREQWIDDEHQKSCYCCDKPFMFMVRRRHHCRSCGRIFCSSCSQFFINGKYIDTSFQRFLRLCEFCHKKIDEYIKDMDRKHYFKQQSQTSTQKPPTNSDSEGESDDDLSTNNDYAIDMSSEKDFLESLNVEISKKMEVVALHLCRNNDIEEKWVPLLAKMTVKAVTQTKMDTLYHNLIMDITQYVKIKRVETAEENVTRAFRGYVTRKNVVNKHMKTDLRNPKIIIVTPSIELSAFEPEAIKFQEIVTREKPILKKLMEKLLRFNPDIIFVESTVNILALEYLQGKGVTVISKLKPKVVNNIKKVGKIRKKIEKLYNFHKFAADQIIGTCKRVYFKKFESHNDSCTLMFLEDQDSPMVSILLADPLIDTLTFLKKIMKRMLKTCRQLMLQKYLLEADMCYLNKQHTPFSGYFDQFIDTEFQSVEMYLLKKSLTYSKLNYVRSKFFNLPDIGKQQIMQGYFKALPYPLQWSFKQQSDLCSKPQYKSLKFYSKDPLVDIPLGRYIVLKVANLQKKCQYCGRSKLNHTSVFYIGKSMIQIVVENQFHVSRAVMQILDEPAEDNTSLQSNIADKEKVYLPLKEKLKSTLHPKESVCCYFECESCGERLCEPIELRRTYLENSLLFFLYKLSKSLKPESVEEEKGKCPHHKRYRVFKYEQACVKFLVKPLKLFTLDENSFTEQCSLEYIKDKHKEFLEGLLYSELKPIHRGFQALTEHVNASSLSPLVEQALLRKSSQKIAFALEGVNKIREILMKISEEFSLIYKEESQKLQENSDYTAFVRQSHNYYIILQNLTKLVAQVDYRLKKSRNPQTFEQQQIAHSPQKNYINEDGTDSIVSGSPSVLPTIDLSKAQSMQSFSLSPLPQRFKNLRWVLEDNQLFNYIPIYKQDPISYIAFVLNSKSFSAMRDTDNKQIRIKVTQTNSQMPDCQAKKVIQEVRETLKMENKQRDYKDNLYQVTVFHNREFEKIRVSEGISFEMFVGAIVGCASWDNTGGKSGSKFAKSYNDMIVMKIINNKEFLEFRKFVSNYIEYVRESKVSKCDSLLAKIFGIFQVNLQGTIYNCIVMQNIFFKLKMHQVIKYDLKGSQSNRFAFPKQGKDFTGLDTNFKVDRNSQPLNLSSQLHQRVLKTLQRDCNFLSEQQVIDYSLLLIIDQKKSLLRMGIIDFMRPYHLTEKIESLYKEIKSGGAVPTVIPPVEYSARFMDAMTQYFLKINSD